MSLRARLVLLCAFFFALAGLAAAVGAVLVVRANDARRDHTDLATATHVAADLETTYVGNAAAIRSYFLSGETSGLDDYNAGRVRALELNGQLRGLVMDEAPLMEKLSDVTDAARAWRDEAILPLITLQQSSGPSQAVLDQYRDGPSVPTFRKLAETLSSLRSQLDRTEQRADAHEATARDDVSRFAIGSVAAAMLLIALLSIVARSWISRPIERLAVVLEEEPTDAPVRIRGAKELQRLGRGVGAMRDRARAEIDLAARTREGLAQNAALLMSMRAQLETSPDNLPVDWTVAAQLVPATGIVAGDCYNVDVLGRQYLTVVVVDVAGHGAGSAVVALRANELLRAAVRSYDDPRDAVRWASEQLSDLDPEMFVTAFVGRLNFETGVLRYVNAGHPPMLVCDGLNAAELPPTGPLIGPFPGQWRSHEAIIGPGQMLVCFTDGLIEARDAKRDEYGLTRLRRALHNSYGESPEKIVKQCLDEVDAYAHGHAHDDITLTIIARRLDG